MKDKAIENFTTKLRKILELETPVNLDSTLNDLKGVLIYEPINFLEIEKLTENQNNFKIAFPIKMKSSEDLNYKIAHALGHLFLHMGYLVNEEKWSSNQNYHDSAFCRFGHNIEEYEADKFARSLLMPKGEFFRISKMNLKQGVYNAQNIAKHFKMKEDIVTQRGLELFLFSYDFE